MNTTVSTPDRSLKVRRMLPSIFTGVLLVLGPATTAWAHWPDTNATKWVQLPNPSLTGYDVLAAQAQPSGTQPGQPIILADDFLCNVSGPITDIHIWASWLDDTNFDSTLPITLAIWSDVPATNNPNGELVPSHPGTMLWSQTFSPGQYSEQPWGSANPNEWFWNPDPAPQGIVLGPDRLIFQYNFYPDPAKTFRQQGTAAQPVTYWLSMTAVTNVVPFGWKTAITNWNDDAVFGHLDPNGNPLADWQELRDPRNIDKSLDLSFAITTTPEPPPPPPPPPAPTNKWAQFPDLFGGFDISAATPNIVADDFLCTEAGTITNIHIWASWINDEVGTDTTFTVSIWSDLPLGSAAPFGSRPGRRLWSETFVPGSYSYSFYADGQEQFYNPSTGQISPESMVWLYDFTPRVPFCQRGSATQPTVYWLVVSAQSTAPPGTAPGEFGWKTSTNHWGDNAVFGHLDAAGNPLNDWQKIINPTTGISFDLAFLLDNGPPDADCEPARTPKYVQFPDTSPNGRDVLATVPEIIADDFPCRLRGPISGITIWGSWNEDLVDTNVVFQVSLWSDVPSVPSTNGSFSHPGSLLCQTLFYPPQTVGTSLQRYSYHLYADNLTEFFYNPDLPGAQGFIGADTQIWQYNLYPFEPSCWQQKGTPFARKTYWISVTALESNTNTLFGWKTSTRQWGDAGVYGHVNPVDFSAIGDWKPLVDPRTSTNLNLAFALRQFPVVGINKDFVNTTGSNVDGVQVTLAGVHQIIWHYDGTPAPWPNFQVNIVGGNTVLTWSGLALAPGTTNHVGFEMAAASPVPPTPPILSWNWLSAGAVLPALQVNHHLLGGNRPVLVLQNNLAPISVALVSGKVEFYDAPVPLDQLNANAVRNPLATMLLTPPSPCMPVGGSMIIPLPEVQSNYMYAVFVLDLGSCPSMLSPQDAGGSTLGDDTLDFIQLPLDTALAPVIQSISLSDGNVMIDWSSVEGRTYQLLSASSLNPANWSDVSNGGIQALGTDTTLTVPVGANTEFYRVSLLPQ